MVLQGAVLAVAINYAGVGEEDAVRRWRSSNCNCPVASRRRKILLVLKIPVELGLAKDRHQTPIRNEIAGASHRVAAPGHLVIRCGLDKVRNKYPVPFSNRYGDYLDVILNRRGFQARVPVRTSP